MAVRRLSCYCNAGLAWPRWVGGHRGWLHPNYSSHKVIFTHMCVGERLNMQFLISEPLLGAGTILSHSNIPHRQPTYLIFAHISPHTKNHLQWTMQWNIWSLKLYMHPRRDALQVFSQCSDLILNNVQFSHRNILSQFLYDCPAAEDILVQRLERPGLLPGMSVPLHPAICFV